MIWENPNGNGVFSLRGNAKQNKEYGHLMHIFPFTHSPTQSITINLSERSGIPHPYNTSSSVGVWGV
jgi:hypothetical protein